MAIFVFISVLVILAAVILVVRKKCKPHSNDEEIKQSLEEIKQKLNIIMATQAELAKQLRDITAQNEKARQEILDKIATLEQAIIDAGNTTPEVDAALADLKASVQADDDLNPDEVPTTTEAPTPEA